jgi:cytochrome P450
MKAIQLFEKGTDLGLGASPESYLSDALIYAFHPSKRRTVLMSENDHQHQMKHITLKTTSAMLFSQPGFLSIRIRDAMTKWFISASIPSNGAISGAPVNGVQLVKDIFLNLAVAVLFREVVNKDRLENLLLNWFQMNISWPMELFGLTAWSKGQRSMKELESFLTTEIRQRIHSGKGYGNDLIGCYLSASEKWCDPSKGKAIDSVAETTVMTDCFTFVDSFCNNIACACVWFLVCLEQAPGIKQVLITEVRNFQGEFDIPAIQSTSVLPYLSATIEETLRIYGFLRRNTLKRVALFDLEFDEYTIPKGTPVYLPLGTLNFNEENFHSATTFDPLRFMPGGVNHDTDGAYSFGLGHHICPGAILARSILMVFAFTLLEGFDTSAKLDQSFEPVFQRVFTSSSSNVAFPYPADGLVYTSVTPRPARVETMLRSR